MNRRTTILLTGMALLGLAFGALPQFASGQQSDPMLGTWQLNVAKSKYSPGPAPKSNTVNIQADGQNHKLTARGINAEGNPTSAEVMWIYDGMPHPTDNPNFDAQAATRIDAYTIIFSRTKAGKLVGTVTNVLSQDGKTATNTTTGINANGRPVNNITVFEKQ
jgi:hypothetical protein